MFAIDYPEEFYAGNTTERGGVGSMFFGAYGDTTLSRSIVIYDVSPSAEEARLRLIFYSTSSWLSVRASSSKQVGVLLKSADPPRLITFLLPAGGKLPGSEPFHLDARLSAFC